METRHAEVGGYGLHYSFTAGDARLVIQTAPDESGALIFGSTPENSARTVRVTKDYRHGIGTMTEVPLATFPFADAIAAINSSQGEVAAADRRRILEILNRARLQAESPATGSL